MVAANLGDLEVVKYLISKGADLNAHDLGKKNDGSFGSSVEPLMPVDYAIGVGTFVPNNAVIIHHDVMNYMFDEMKKRGIEHTTSECTLRGFTCALANVDPKTATPAEIAKVLGTVTGILTMMLAAIAMPVFSGRWTIACSAASSRARSRRRSSTRTATSSRSTTSIRARRSTSAM